MFLEILLKILSIFLLVGIGYFVYKIRLVPFDALKTLNERERNVIEAFYGINQPELTLEEIGSKYGLTRERVRQIKEKAIRRLRTCTKNKILKTFLG